IPGRSRASRMWTARVQILEKRREARSRPSSQATVEPGLLWTSPERLPWPGSCLQRTGMKHRLLVVDDERAILMALGEYFRRGVVVSIHKPKPLAEVSRVIGELVGEES